MIVAEKHTSKGKNMVEATTIMSPARDNKTDNIKSNTRHWHQQEQYKALALARQGRANNCGSSNSRDNFNSLLLSKQLEGVDEAHMSSGT
ncbi:unnamed protein product [Prunus brigantina]